MKLDALLEAVRDAPDDDEPRLVFADYLQEHGDPRGELIIVQCLRERLEREEKTTTLEYRTACWRERTLLSQLRVPSGAYRRGFVHRIELPTASARTLGAQADELLETIVIGTDVAIELDAQSAMAAIPHLPLDESLLGEEHGLPHPLLVPSVTAVRYRRPTARMIRDLIEQETPRLRSVTCAGNLQFTANSLQIYAQTANYDRLERFALWRVEEAEASYFIANAPSTARSLTAVVESDERPGFWIGDSFRQCRAIPHLRELHLDVAPIDRDAVDRLHREATHLESWTIAAGIYDDALEAVANGRLTKQLRHLEVSFAGYPDVAKLVTAPWQRLTSLALGNAFIGPELANAPALESLVSLRLFGCKIADERAIFRRWPWVRIE